MAIPNFNKTHAFFDENRWFSTLTWALLACLLVFLGHSGPRLNPDTGSYLEMNPLRSAVYPLILQLNAWFFGQGNFHCLVFGQLAYGTFTAIVLAQKIRKLFNLKSWVLLPLVFCLLSPYYGPGRFGNTILTEAICYPTFLLASAFLLEGLIRKNTRFLLYFLGLTALLILTRRQFLFLYPVFLTILIYITVFERKAFRVKVLVFSFIVSILATNALERSYQYLQHGHFSTIPFTGIQLIIAPLYIAAETDVHIFENDLERKIFKETQDQLQQKHLSFHSLGKTSFFDMTVYTHFYENYNDICWRTLSPVLSNNGVVDPYQMDKMMTQMALKLMYHNLKPYLTLYLLNIIFNMGGYYYCLLLGIIALLAVRQHYKHRDPLSLSCLLVLTLSLANYTLVALVEPVMRRYSAYTDTLQVSLLLICIILAFQVEHVRHSR